jgi:hypothetical protein
MTLSLQGSDLGVSRVPDRGMSSVDPQLLLVMLLLNIIFRPLHGPEGWVNRLVHGFDDGCGRSWGVTHLRFHEFDFCLSEMVYLLPERVEQG